MAADDRKIKIVFCGDSGVGKTVLIRRFVNKEFQLQEITIGANFYFKKLEINGEVHNLRIW